MNNQELLTRMTFEGINRKYKDYPNMQELYDRANYELSVINQMGFTDYILIVADFLKFADKCGHMKYEEIKWLEANCGSMTLEALVAFVDAHQTEPGISKGPGRGSAAGSIVCYGTDITDIDPIKFELMFERFLNPSRKTMPDIDSDFSFESRTLTIEYCRKKYGKDCVCGINTVSTAAPKGAIRLVARALAQKTIEGQGLDKKSEKAETIKKDFLQLADKIAKAVNKDAKTMDDCIDDLNLAFADDKLALQIISIAKIFEGTITNTGTHAAGIIIADQPVKNHMALMYDVNNEVYKVQCDMIQAEGIHGLLKMDFLGLRTLSILTFAARQIKASTGTYIDFNNVPVEQEVIDKVLRPALTATVFQFSSAFMKQIIEKINPQTIEDMILINAIGRPGPMQFIDPIAAVKAGKVLPEYLIPEVEEALGVTYGYPVYQEQIMKLMTVAGMTMGEADTIRKHMSKKHVDEFEAFRPKFVEGFVVKGADREKTNAFWDQLVEFAKYAFNKSHAAAYVDVAYKCAWMLYHYPAYWICASLEYVQDTDELLSFLEDARKIGIEILQPDVNKSHDSFSVESDTAVRFGLCSIKGCGDSLKEVVDSIRDKSFASLPEFILETRFGKGVLTALCNAGALDSFSTNRQAINNAIEVFSKKLDVIKTKEKAIATDEKVLTVITDDNFNPDNWKEAFENAGIKATTKNCPKADAKNKTLDKKKTELAELTEEFLSMTIGVCEENHKNRMSLEKDMLGFYLTEHPIDSYEIAKDVTPLNKVFAGEYKVVGLVTEVTHKVTKAKGTPIIFFRLEDKTANVKINCWTKETEQFGALIHEDKVLELTVFAKSTQDEEDETKVNTEIKVLSIKEPAEKSNTAENSITLRFDTIQQAADFLNANPEYIDENGVWLNILVEGNTKMFRSNVKYNQMIAYKKGI